MLSIGEKFPEFSGKAVISNNMEDAFIDINSESYKGKWKVFFFWPKDFTFVCPTEIAEFGKLNEKFQDRDAQIIGASTDSDCRAFFFVEGNVGREGRREHSNKVPP